MIGKILLSLLFILPLAGSLSVLVKSIRNDLVKFKTSGQKAIIAKLIGYSIAFLIALYLTVFLTGITWIPGFNLPSGLKTFSYYLTAFYLFGVIGISYALSKAIEVGGSSSKIVTSVSKEIKKS